MAATTKFDFEHASVSDALKELNVDTKVGLTDTAALNSTERDRYQSLDLITTGVLES
jgi:hypothetical protein